MKKKAFRFPMSHTESIIGWVYVFVHVFAMTYILSALNIYVFPAMGFQLSTGNLNLLYYGIGFIFLLTTLFKFMKQSFADLCSNVLDTLIGVGAGYILYILLSYAVSSFLSLFLSDLTNPNSSAVINETRLHPNTMLAIGVLLAPIVEEILFRGVVFGTLRKKSRLLAYVVSSVFFSIYHLWSYLIYSFNPVLLLFLVQYVPAGIVLAWSYERGRNVWCPVFLHMLINYISISIEISFGL